MFVHTEIMLTLSSRHSTLTAMLLHLKMSQPPIYHYRSKNNIQRSTFKGEIKNFTLI